MMNNQESEVNQEPKENKIFNIKYVEKMHVENMHQHTHVHTEAVDPATDDEDQQSSIDHISKWQSLNVESFCLFVLFGETYSGESFSIAKSCALRYTPLDYQKRYNIIFLVQ